MGIDLVRSWFCENWFRENWSRGSWFHENWSRGTESLTHLDKSMVILINVVPVCHLQTVTPFSLYILIPRPLPFILSICVHNNTQKWSSTPVYSCMRVQMEGKNGGGLGTRLVTLSISKLLYLCFVVSLFSLSYSCLFDLDYPSQNLCGNNDLWPWVHYKYDRWN